MARFVSHHDDPAPLARAAAVRSSIERDPLTRERAREQTKAQRLRISFELSRTAQRLRRR